MKLTKQVWLVSSVALAACGGGSSTADAPIAAIDAPPGGSIDAPIGSPDGAHTIDAATSPDAAVPGPVTVNAFTPKGLPASGLPIAFLNADGSVVLETTTDSNGVATATMLAGGSVTLGAASTSTAAFAPAPTAAKNRVYTWLGVKPGDTLFAGAPQATFDTTVTVEIDVPPVANAVNYNASVTCASNATMQNIGIPVVLHMQFDSSCTSSDIFIAAVDGTGTILGGFFAQAQPTTDGAVWTLSGDPLAATAVATSFANVPANFTTVKSNNQLADGLFTMSSSTGVATVVDGTASFTATLAPPTSGLDMVNLFNATSTSGETFLVAKRTAPSTSVSFDYSTLAVPQLSSLPTFDVPSTTLSWTESGSGTADLSVVALTINTDATRAFQWEIIGPHTGASIALPTLPTSLAQFTPLSTDTIVVNEGAVATVTGGYDALRSVVFSVNLNKVQIARAVRHLGDTLIESVFVAGTN